jgi:hypothetical protein
MSCRAKEEERRISKITYIYLRHESPSLTFYTKNFQNIIKREERGTLIKLHLRHTEKTSWKIL